MTAERNGHALLPEPARTALVRLADITRDPRVNTRDLDEQWVDQRVDRYRAAAVGTLDVSYRDDGTYVVVDGQHRAELKRRAGYADSVVECHIYEGLTLAQEAALFVILNDSRKTKPVHEFLAQLTEGDPEACEIAAIALRCSWNIAESAAAGTLSCITTLRRIHRNDRTRKQGAQPVDLERTLRAIAEAWGHAQQSAHRDIVGGIGAIFNTYEEAPDPAQLAKSLAAEYPDGPALLLGRAKGLATYEGGSVLGCVAQLSVKAYNHGRRSRKLPEWRR